MKITTVLFDMDGTLLPMDNDVFTRCYFKLLAGKLAPLGYDPKELVDGIWKATAAMVKNDGVNSNHDVFWKAFADVMGDRVYDDRPVFYDFYEHEFHRAKEVCGQSERPARIIAGLKERGFRTVLASNPIFPMTAQRARISWAGVDPEAFELITSYENSAYSKPNPAYFTDLAKRLNVTPAECLMVGNDVEEDMISASRAGMAVFLLTDNMINRGGSDISAYPHGGFDELESFLAALCPDKSFS